MNTLIVGSGAVGRGLLGNLLIRAGHAVTFVDTNLSVVEQLKERLYYPTIKDLSGEISLRGPCRSALTIPSLDDIDAVFVSARVQNFGSAGKALAIRLAERKSDRVLPIIVCENTPNAAEKLRLFTGIFFNVFYCSGIAECIIPEIPQEVAAIDPILTYADPRGYLIIDEHEWRGEKISANGIQYSNNFAFNWDLKWYCHCALHLVVGLLGRKAGIKFIHETLKLENGNKVTRLVWSIADALVEKYPLDKDGIHLRLHREIQGLVDPTRPDTCERVTRDLRRKIQDGERLIDTLQLLGGKNAVLEEMLEYAKSII